MSLIKFNYKQKRCYDIRLPRDIKKIFFNKLQFRVIWPGAMTLLFFIFFRQKTINK